ncbi:DNA cytosine methyltransferase [Pseudomonas cremoricolorata]|uniref:DNA (cytosine-5-)-methyltransferase n=1 Tax=Pseudomonas cremoricolorata TaxID=157783 RepID=A0A089YFN8_9PSED|nr:DNA cytosine methyltransferase [Pseudomonas cremoricolorata]AIR90548.1 cytosine methyltransferase [Pseudomonas cremoricolorata]
MNLTYGSVCSGIEAATVAWHPLGWHADWYAEIEPYPCAVLAYRYPKTPNHGDMTRLAAMVLSGKIQAPDVLVGGTPCQAFSVAGMREGLADPRGALTIKYVELLDAIDHVRTLNGQAEAVCTWENVPGVLSDKGNAFGCFLGALVGESEELQPPGGKWKDAGCVYGPRRTVAWRVLDAQYFGLAQRRRRVFVVASARAGFDPLEVLFEREGLRRDTPPRRGQGQDVAGTVTASTGGVDENDAVDGRLAVYGGNNTAGPIDIAPARNACASASGRMDFESEAFVVHGTQDPCILTDQAFALGRNSGQENAVLAFAENSRSEVRLEGGDGQVVGTLSTGGGKPGQGLPCIAFSCKDHCADAGELAPTLRAMGHGASHPNAGGQIAVCLPHAIQAGALRENPNSGPDGIGVQLDHAYTLEARAEVQAVHSGSQVRRLTPRECERLQGFPDYYTLIPYRGRVAGLCPDGPRYKAIGNSKAVPVVRWIGQRLQQQLERSA